MQVQPLLEQLTHSANGQGGSKMKIEKWSNGLTIQLTKRFYVDVYFRNRQRYGFEWCSAGKWFNIWWGSPKIHAWWSISAYFNWGGK
jgi:hypothetical protein